MKKISIAIDGFAGTGKGTTAQGVAQQLGYIYVDTGAMYRALTLYLLQHEIDYTDLEKVRLMLADVRISFLHNTIIDHNDVMLNGINVESAIRTVRVQDHVAKVADISFVRTRMVEQQQHLGISGGIVMEGRDIGSVVLPNAELKIFLTCDVDIRAIRRQKQLLQKGEQQVDLEAMKQNIIARDTLDRQRIDVLFATYASQVRTLDTSNITIDEQIAIIVGWAREEIYRNIP